MAYQRFATQALGVALTGLLGCIGTVDAPSGFEGDFGNANGQDEDGTDQAPVDTDGDGIPDSPPPGGEGPGGDGDEGPGGDGDEGPGGDGDDSGYRSATLGYRCSAGKRERFVVISRGEGSCEAHARALDDAKSADVLRVTVGEAGTYSGPVSLCDGSACSDVEVNLTLSADGTSVELETALAGESLDRSLTATPCDYDAVVPPARDALATDIAIREFSLNQGVKVALASNGQEVVSRNAPVVEGRPGLARVFVEPSGAFASRPIIARLTLENGGVPQVLETTLTVSGSSSDASRESSFNFELGAEQVRSDTRYSVSLHESEACGGAVDSASEARFPASGTASLAAESAGTSFKVALVPVRYNGDGSGREPDLSEERVAQYREFLYSIFPLAQIEVTVRPAMTFSGSVLANGNGWSELLDQCLSQRDSDNGDAREYYYCMFDPAATFGDYCRGGCVAGLGPVPSAGDALRRGAIGLGFGDAGGTMAHELGHALGRPHAPCGGVAGPDPGFPYANGGVGAWGYDMRSKNLLAPDEHSDLMGYCDSAWISDYNYKLVFNRFQSVLTAPLRSGEPLALTSVIVDADSSLKLGRDLSLSHTPPGESVRVRYFDAQGSELMSADGSFAAVTHVSGGIIYVPRAPEGSASIDIEGFGQLTL